MASPDDLWIVDFGDPFPGEPAHHRPAVVAGPPERFGDDFPFALVCPLTTTGRGLSLHVEVEPTRGNGLDEVSYIQCELVRSVNRRRLVHPLGRIERDVSDRLRDILRMLLDL